jgi:hypothetical protein
MSWIEGLKLIDPTVRLIMGKIASQVLGEVHKKEGSINEAFDIIKAYQDKFKDLSFDKSEIPRELLLMEGFFLAYCTLVYAELKGETEKEFIFQEPEYPRVHGFTDLVCLDGTAGYEFKYSASPEFYMKKFIMEPQLGIYFLGNPELQRITVRALRVPNFKKGKEETKEDFVSRVKKDVLRQPNHYIMEMSFWRNEFDLELLKEKLRLTAQEMYSLGSDKEKYYQTSNRDNCFKCQFIDVCSSGVVSKTIYKKREFKNVSTQDFK